MFDCEACAILRLLCNHARKRRCRDPCTEVELQVAYSSLAKIKTMSSSPLSHKKQSHSDVIFFKRRLFYMKMRH